MCKESTQSNETKPLADEELEETIEQLRDDFKMAVDVELTVLLAKVVRKLNLGPKDFELQAQLGRMFMQSNIRLCNAAEGIFEDDAYIGEDEDSEHV